jgi:hypothetical protein
MYADDVSVLEVKITGTIPFWLSRLLASTGCMMRSHSKYCNALERSDPVLHSMLAPNWRQARGIVAAPSAQALAATESAPCPA